MLQVFPCEHLVGVLATPSIFTTVAALQTAETAEMKNEALPLRLRGGGVYSGLLVQRPGPDVGLLQHRLKGLDCVVMHEVCQ